MLLCPTLPNLWTIAPASLPVWEEPQDHAVPGVEGRMNGPFGPGARLCWLFLPQVVGEALY
jgi:hypothetical protein